MLNFEIKDIRDWEILVSKIVPLLKYNILLLKGNLGMGKTTFTQFLLKALGSEDNVDSPTYSIVNEYQVSQGKIFHFDFYRIDSVEELYDMGIEEYLDSGFLSIIEWPDIFEEELEGFGFHEMTIQVDNDVRIVSFK